MTTAVNHRGLLSILGHSQASIRLSCRLSEKSDERKFPSHKDSALTLPYDGSLIRLKFETEDPNRNDTQVNVALWFCSADKLVSSHQGERYLLYLSRILAPSCLRDPQPDFLLLLDRHCLQETPSRTHCLSVPTPPLSVLSSAMASQ